MSDKNLESAIQNATNLEAIRAALHNGAAEQGVRYATSWDERVAPVNTASFARDTDPFAVSQPEQPRDGQGKFVSTQQGQSVAKTVTMSVAMPNGRTVKLTGSSETDIRNQVNRVLQAFEPTPEEVETRNWENAVQGFLNSDEGAQWEGGNINKETLGLILNADFADRNEDHVNALAQAYAEMKSRGLVVAPGAEQTSEQTRAIEDLRRRVSLRSGNDAIDELSANAGENLSPQEIVELYKQSLQEQGIDANDAFVRSLSDSGSGIQDGLRSADALRSSGMFGR